MELREGNAALSIWSGYPDDGLQRGERHAHIGRVGGDAVLARAEDRQNAVLAINRRAAGPGLAFVARRAGVVEVVAACALEEVAAGGGGVAQLRRGTGQDCASEERVTLHDPFVVSGRSVWHERADLQAAINLLDGVETGNP